MRTQKQELKQEIKEMEVKLQKAIFDKDLFEQRAILIDLDIAKSTLYNIQ